MDELLSLRPHDRVRVLHDDGTEADYEVKFEPWTLGHGEWVIGLKGMAGGYKLSRVVKVLERAGVVLCVLCRRPNPNPSCSACPTCIPPDEGEMRLQGKVKALEAEVRMYQESCERLRDECNTMLDLLRRITGNDDVTCRLDHHGYCQEHNFAAPCPIPEAHRLTGGGIEYIATNRF